jgi:hypothetical protein
VLIVSPHFPPVNAADMHRVRVSLPHFAGFGWQPHVLAVDAASQHDVVQDPLLERTLPADVPVTRVSALPLGLTRPFGIGNVAIRAFGQLYRSGARLIRDEHIDLVYVSTTMFVAMALGRLWKRRFGVPYVLDMQDPWVSDYQPAEATPRGGKHGLASRLHAVLEPFTMRAVDGLIAVSPAYTATLQRRYPGIRGELCATVPFGASEADFAVARTLATPAEIAPAAGRCRALYLGRGGPDMATAARILFGAVAAGRAAQTAVQLSFVGTAYAPAGQGRPTIAPLAAAYGLADLVDERTDRVPYFAGLKLLDQADVLLVLGSDDPQYSPSKVYPYLLARRPIIAVLHEASPVVDLLRHAGALVVTFGARADEDRATRDLTAQLPAFLDRLPFTPSLDDAIVAPFSARELTRRQCVLFDAVIAERAAARGVPCLG